MDATQKEEENLYVVLRRKYGRLQSLAFLDPPSPLFGHMVEQVDLHNTYVTPMIFYVTCNVLDWKLRFLIE